MKFLKLLLPVLVAACGFAVVHADEFATSQEMRERDDEALADFIKTKRAITVQEKGGHLMISGDVRTEWKHMGSKTRGHRDRGHGSNRGKRHASKNPAPYATNDFDIEANLMFDYKADRTWSSIMLKFDNSAGIEDKRVDGISDNKRRMFGSGTGSDIFLRKAYMGYNVMEQGTSRFDIELGRRRLYDVFDSRVQFRNLFDGLLLSYVNSFEGVGDFQAKAAAFVVDQNVNHFGQIAELRLLNIGDSGLDVGYSMIHWTKHGVNRANRKFAPGTAFCISQVSVAYRFHPELLRFKSKVYAAFLHNHTAKRIKQFHHERDPNAFYVGFSVGEVKKRNDWAIDLNYQWVQVNSIPESDVSGIGRDNPRRISVYNKKRYGYANYKGWQLESFYALTDNMTLALKYRTCRQQSKKVGGSHKSHKFELDAIYAF